MPKVEDEDVLLLISRGLHLREIARRLGVSPGTVHYRISKLIREGLVEEDVRETLLRRSETLTRAKVYRLTAEGLRRLSNVVRKSDVGDDSNSLGVEVHGGVYGFEVLRPGKIPEGARRTGLRHVEGWEWEEGNVHVKLLRSRGSWRLYVYRLAGFGRDRVEAEADLERKRLAVENVLRSRGFVLRPAGLSGRWKWGVLGDPAASRIPNVVRGEVAAKDDTPRPGTLHLGPRELDAYVRGVMAIPRLVEVLERLIERLEYRPESRGGPEFL